MFEALRKPPMVLPDQFWRRRYDPGRALCVLRLVEREDGALLAVFRKGKTCLASSLLGDFEWEYTGNRRG